MGLINRLEERVLRGLRYRYKKLPGVDTISHKSLDLVNLDGESASAKIAQAILSQSPFLLSRFGSEEVKWYINYKLLSRPYINRVASFVKCETEYWKKDDRVIDNLTFQPKDLSMTEVFVKATDEAIPRIDLMGSWLKQEQSTFINFHSSCDFAYLVDIEPYYHQEPWSSSLEGKKVLVIHPMEESIRKQYSKRRLLFNDQRVLPDFELVTLKAKYFDEPGFDTWLKIFNFYIDEINKIEFDVAIIGCGSWGMPLAAEIKKKGKVALHLGGATQILFGIIGSRWETLYPGFNERFVNEHWVRPQSHETPVWAKNYDGNSYW